MSCDGQLLSVTSRIVGFSDESGTIHSSGLLFFSEIEGEVSGVVVSILLLLSCDTDSSSASILVSGIVDNGFFALRAARVAERTLERGDCRGGSWGGRLGLSVMITKFLLALAMDDKPVVLG